MRINRGTIFNLTYVPGAQWENKNENMRQNRKSTVVLLDN